MPILLNRPYLVNMLIYGTYLVKNSQKYAYVIYEQPLTLSLPSYTGSALKRELNFCNGYLSLLYFCTCSSPLAASKWALNRTCLTFTCIQVDKNEKVRS